MLHLHAGPEPGLFMPDAILFNAVEKRRHIFVRQCAS
jgi:hypothetical protein